MSVRDPGFSVTQWLREKYEPDNDPAGLGFDPQISFASAPFIRRMLAQRNVTMSEAERTHHSHGLAGTPAGQVLMDMRSAAQRRRDHRLQMARLAGAALARKAAS